MPDLKGETMKITLTAAALGLSLAFSAPAVAQDDLALRVEYCAGIGELAEAIMSARQSEAPMSHVMAIFAQEWGTFASVALGLTEMAYELPAFLTAENQARAVASFRNDAESMCFDATRDM